jgi:hypothetical protein
MGVVPTQSPGCRPAAAHRQALAHDAGGHWDRLTLRPSRCHHRQARATSSSPGRATYVPHRTDKPGTERATTVTLAPLSSWPSPLSQHERIP